MESKKKKTGTAHWQLFVNTNRIKRKPMPTKISFDNIFSARVVKMKLISDVNGYLRKEVCQFSLDMYQVILPR